MQKSRGRGMCWALGLGAALGAVGAAKPPDLPVQNDVRCQRECEAPKGGESEPEALPLWLDLWCPCVMPYLVERVCEQLRGTGAPGVPKQVDAEPQEPTFGPDSAATAKEAQRLYELAERCVRDGKLDKARALLRQAHMVNPICRFGRRAIDRLQQLEGSGEEPSEPSPTRTQEPPSPGGPSGQSDGVDSERAFRRMRERTVPLGMVELQCY
jgi:hypothetical protein